MRHTNATRISEYQRSGRSERPEDKELQNRKLKCSLYLLFSSVLGLVLSSYSVYVEYKIEENHDYEALCDISERISCTKVFSSDYGKGFGVFGKIFGDDSVLNPPNGVFGICFYGFLIFTSFFYNKLFVKFQIVLSGVAVMFSAYLAYLLYFVLDDFCIVCVTTYICNFVNLLTTMQKLQILTDENVPNKNNTRKTN